MTIKKILILIFCFVSLFSCQLNEKEKKLMEVLSFAGENQAELEKVLAYYQNDSLKLNAAIFLISNMPGNISYDSTRLYKYRPILLRLDSLRHQERLENIVALDMINDEWGKFIEDKSIVQDVYYCKKQDLHSISSGYLIDNIDKSFKAWQNTLFKDRVDFNTYLQYILPYRRLNGYVIEPWRDYFVFHYGQSVDQFSSPHQAVDSLLKLVENYQVNWMKISNYPFICLEDYNLSKMSKCPDRCWFNSMLLSAFGIPCAIDFVPVWGNRNSSHMWNSIIIGGKTYSFEATGGTSMWRNQLVYNNVWIDKYWMKSRLPKVLRYSYESIQEGPTSDKNSQAKNIPNKFLSAKYKDVSDEYFTTSDIQIQIRDGKTPDGLKYAYLFVFNEDRWQPAYWGEIKSSKVFFKKMGRDIVYLPAFYENGQIIPFNDAFILKQDGGIQYLTADIKVKLPVILERKYYARPDIEFWKEWNIGSYFEVADDIQFNYAKKIYTVDSCESRPNIWRLRKSINTRYIRYLFPEKLDVLAELSFYRENKDDSLELIEGKILSSDEKSLVEMNKLFDGDILSYADLNHYQSNGRKNEKLWVGMDFEKIVRIDAIGFCPRNDKNNIIKGLEYELFYWNNQWISLGKKIATDFFIEFDNIPGNSLLLLKCTMEGVENRIFTWEENSQKWW